MVPLFAALAVPLLELLDAAAGINQLLLARVERVASAAHIGMYVAALLRAACGECISATTSNCGFYVLWVDASLHGFLLINTVIGSQTRMPCVNRPTP